MKAALDALEAQYRLDEAECEQQITRDRSTLQLERDALLETSKNFPELQAILLGLPGAE